MSFVQDPGSVEPRTIDWSEAAWIWSDRATRPYHNVVCFRRTFDVTMPGAAKLKITADARYEVHVNGQWLGFGPARGWPSTWAVDEYDLTGILRPGTNVISVIVQHLGLSTFQYLQCAPGLLAELTYEEGGVSKTLATDADWRALPSDAHVWPVPRVSCQLGWEEQFDARRWPTAWTAASFDDSAWPAAVVVRRPGEGDHRHFVSRGVPQLTRDPASALRLLAIERVKPAPYVWSINPRDLLNAGEKSANYIRGRMLLATEIVSDVSQPIQFHRPHTIPWTDWKLNGEPLTFDDKTLQKTDPGVAHATLKVGRNILVGRLQEKAHHWWAVMNAWTDSPVTLSNPAGQSTPTPWLAFGPFGSDADRTPLTDGMCVATVDAATFPPGATVETFERLWNSGTPDAADVTAAFAVPVPVDAVAVDDVYARCASERIFGAASHIDAAEAMLHDTAEWTTIHPDAAGDVRVLLDFGREVVGFHEIELDAPAGCVVDNHNFEFIQPDGRFNLAEGMNNSFRYICRDGVQTYRTLLRRGFRYSWLSFRNFDRPVRVRLVRVLMSTYPQVRRGSFACSDPMLDRIWEVGAHSVACCSEDTYTDCPTYEQTFWVGDGRNEALVDLVANGDPRLSARSLRIAACSLERSPIIESQVPSGWQNLLPAWSFLWMRWAQEHVALTGDLALGRELVEANAKQVAALEAFVGPRGLIKMLAWNLFDWAAMDTPPDGEVTHVNCLAVLGLRQTAMLARQVGDDARAMAWDLFADRLAAAVNQHLWNDAKQAYIDCIRGDGTRSPVFSQQTQTAAYISGVATAVRADHCRAAMHAAPDGFVKAGSPFFMFFLLEGLVREGQFDRLIGTIRDYWGLQINAGATTFWEMYYHDRPRVTRSHCHGWSAAPTYFLSRYVLGVCPAEPGFARVRIEPRPAGLAWARGAVPTPGGVVETSWQFDGEAFTLNVTLPTDDEAEVRWPVDGQADVIRGKLVRASSGGLYVVRGPIVQMRTKLRGRSKGDT